MTCARSAFQNETIMNKRLNFLIFKEDGWWIAQCLEYDIAAQARTIPDIQYEIQRILVGRIAMSEKLGIDPFKDIPPAPVEYQKVFENVFTSCFFF